MREFPDGFRWGAATSAYQIEGGAAERGRSIWDSFCAVPGNVYHGDTADVACDHYGRWAEDVALMAELGLTAYRFSVAWPRVLPAGTGEPDRRGLDFYSRLVDALLERGIEPALTLYHWDLPEALHERGGWLERSTVDAFVDFAGAVRDQLGDRVRLWTTLNEPWVAAMLGYGTSLLPPALADGAAALRAAHHLLLAHGQAVPVLRGGDRQVGITVNLSPMVPATSSAEDAAAAERFDGYHNRWFLDPLLRGAYPQDMADWYGAAFDGVVAPGDLATIAAPLDFLGVNYYCRMHIAAGADAADPLTPRPAVGARQVSPSGVPATAMGWPVEPDGLRQILVRLRADHPGLPPVYITENGAAFHDYADPAGAVHDPERVEYLRGHLGALHEAIAAGVDVRGYFCWSLLDNFEWHQGYAKRFGIVHVDFASQRRTPKTSARWYSEVIRANGLRS
ncbi:GH1 family beta-glucosidase [Phytohabitans kaempferiae]|uniref:Beta-glucosidase n=1 Tax=Phytohabitans kaempferiae TaxID=1620943 RepID=A0ABV6MCV6_9ACTN